MIPNKHMTKQSNAWEGGTKFLELLPARSVILDVGSGKHETHAIRFREAGHIVETCDYHKSATYQGLFQDFKFTKQFDAIWSAHCLEHQPNPNDFLKRIFSILKEGGLLCITVPPLKEEIVSGHINLYYPGLVLYQLVLAGFDCSEAKIKTYGYNISVIVKKKSFAMPKLKYDKPDLRTLKEFFPIGLNWNEREIGFNGMIEEINWT